MSTSVIEVKQRHLFKWPEIKAYIEERPNVICLALQVDEDIEAVLLLERGRVHYIYVNNASRRGGFGTQLLEHALVNYLDDNDAMLIAVLPDNIPALTMLLKASFRIRGMNVSWSDARYVLEYRDHQPDYYTDPTHAAMNDAVAVMSESLYVIEAVPVRKLK